MDDIVRFLQVHLPFHSLPATQLMDLAKTLQIEYFPAGADILQQGGAVSGFLYVLRRGSVDLIRRSEGGAEQKLDTLHEGETFGYPSLIRNKPPIVTVRAHGEVLAYLLPAAQFHRLREAHRDVARFFSRSALDRLDMALQTRLGEALPTVFQGRLGDLIVRPPISIAADATVQAAAQLMRQHHIGALLVPAPQGPATQVPDRSHAQGPGIITDRDLRNRILADGKSALSLVGEVATSPAFVLPADALIFEGLLAMVERKIHHLLIADPSVPQNIIGICTRTDILRRQTRNPLFLPRYLERANTLDEYRRYIEQVQDVVLDAATSGSRVSDIGRIVAVSNDALLRKLLQDAEAALGPPPCPYAWLVCGSEGRLEQTLKTDQDNGLIYADDAPSTAPDYFAQLAQRVVDQLAACGFAPCPGGIMAINPEWRQPLSIWQSYFHQWIHTPDEEALLRTVIFFDYRPIYGQLDVESALRPVIQRAKDNRVFLGRLARAALRQPAPFGFFNRLVLEKRAGQRDVLDLKQRGVGLVVTLARLFALEAGVAATSTIARLRLAAGQANLDVHTAQELEAAFELLSTIRLRHQVAQVKRGEVPNNDLPMSQVSSHDRNDIREALRVIEQLQHALADIYQTHQIA